MTEERQMQSRIRDRGRIGLVGLLIFLLSVAPAMPAFAGRRLFQRRSVRSYGSSGATAGSWGSHGASGGGRVVYTNAHSVGSRGHAAVQQRSFGTYASHGAAGGSPQPHVVASSQHPVRVHYPSNRVVVRRAPAQPSIAQPADIPSRPAVPSAHRGPSSLLVPKRTTLPAPTVAVVPPAPVTRVLERVAYNNDAEVPFSDSISGQSIARIESQPHIVMKPTLEDLSEPVVTNDRTDAPRLETPEHSIEKAATTRAVATDPSVSSPGEQQSSVVASTEESLPSPSVERAVHDEPIVQEQDTVEEQDTVKEQISLQEQVTAQLEPTVDEQPLVEVNEPAEAGELTTTCLNVVDTADADVQPSQTLDSTEEADQVPLLELTAEDDGVSVDPPVNDRDVTNSHGTDSQEEPSNDVGMNSILVKTSRQADEPDEQQQVVEPKVEPALPSPPHELAWCCMCRQRLMST